MYLLITNSFQDFISYTISGIKSFSNSIPYSRLVEKGEGGINVLAILTPIIEVLTLIAIIVIRRGKKKEKTSALEDGEHDKLQLLFMYSLPMLIVIYPIADKIHFLIGVYMAVILMMYELYISINIILKNRKSRTKYLFYAFVFVGLMVYPLYSNLSYMRENYGEYSEAKMCRIHNYENTVYYSVIEKKYNEVSNYIQLEKQGGYNVYILDAEAAISEVPIDVYNKNYSMFNKGNLGGKGEDGIIENIKQSKRSIYLVRQTKYSPNWQAPLKAIEYVRKNLKLVDSVNIYDCYSTEK
jgi:hypothetical protein